MAISSLTGLVGASQQQQIQKAHNRLQSTLSAISSANKLNKASDDVAALSQATLLNSEVAGLKQGATNLARAFSLTQVASDGIDRIDAALQRMKSLAVQSQSVLDEAARQGLNEEFVQLKAVLNDVARQTAFDGKRLLDGSLEGEGRLSLNESIGLSETGDGEDALLAIGNLSAEGLLGSRGDLLSADSAVEVASAVDAALLRVARARADAGSFAQAIDATSAAFETAINNQEAASAYLSDADLTSQASQKSLADLQYQASLATAVQGNKLVPTLLRLIA